MHGTAAWDYSEKPLLVFWETTKACKLACRHCRAEAIEKPLPGELSTEEGLDLIDQVAEFGAPYPILVFTGGDLLMRNDIWQLLEHSSSRGIRTAVAPSVTPLLTPETLDRFLDVGVKAISISLDSALPEIHDSIRGIPGVWKKTVEILREAVVRGMRVQVNTVVMRDTVEYLPETLKLILDLGVRVWEVFYFIPTGRGAYSLDLTPQEYEDVSHFLYDASRYGVLVRTTEGPMFRRVVVERRRAEREGKPVEAGPLYRRLMEKAVKLLGEPGGEARAHTTGTRDGKGIVFVAYNGSVYPSGFLPVPVGNVRTAKLKDIYRGSSILRGLRDSSILKGRCRVCEYRDLCGGSRARAYAYTGDPFAEDPACIYRPSASW